MPHRALGDLPGRSNRMAAAVACRDLTPGLNACSLDELLRTLPQAENSADQPGAGFVKPKGVRCFSSLPASPDTSGHGTLTRVSSSSSVSSLSSAVEQQVITAQKLASQDPDSAADLVDGEEVDRAVADALREEARRQLDTIRELEQMLVVLEPTLQDKNPMRKMTDKVRKIQDKMDEAIWMWARLDRELSKRLRSQQRRKRRKAEDQARRELWRTAEAGQRDAGAGALVAGKQASWELFWISLLDAAIYMLDLQRLFAAFAAFLLAALQAGWHRVVLVHERASRWSI